MGRASVAKRLLWVCVWGRGERRLLTVVRRRWIAELRAAVVIALLVRIAEHGLRDRRLRGNRRGGVVGERL